MRQAGRYLPEYKCHARALRAGSFMGLATNNRLRHRGDAAAARALPLDAAILFSDILTVPDAMGLGLSFAEGEGPRFAHPVRDEADVDKLAVPDMAQAALRDRRRELDPQGADDGRVPLIGFSGSPWTLACYMVEGSGSDDYRTVKTMLYARPDLMHRILAINAEAVAAYLNAQIEAGAQAVMVFDSWGGVLADAAFRTFSLHYTQRVLASLQTREGRPAQCPPSSSRRAAASGSRRSPTPAPTSSASTGRPNLGPASAASATASRCRATSTRSVLFAPPSAIQAEARAVLDSFGNHPGHVFNLGHGISQFTPPENVAELVDEVHRHSRAIRAAGAAGTAPNA
jgi:uroporphyrinogen decarboxylase